MNSRRVKDGILQGLIYFSAGFTIFLLAVIIGFILYKGLPGINVNFLTRQWEEKTSFVMVDKITDGKESGEEGYVSSLDITLKQDKEGNFTISKIGSNSSVKNAIDMTGASYTVKVDDKLSKIGSDNMTDISLDEAVNMINSQNDGSIRLKITAPGGGIVPMLVATIYIILLSLAISAPVGILSAIYLNEYAKAGRALNVIRFAIQNLAGIPSIIYGLFGTLVFVQYFQMRYSILAGALTLSIILLPTIISTTEEALKAIPKTYRESSLGLGATKLQTNYKVVLPNALPGILVAIILSIGRIVGESAALILTAGTVAQIPTAITGNEAGAATLTIKLYMLMKEEGDLSTACSIAIILLALIIVLNIVSKVITSRFLKKQG